MYRTGINVSRPLRTILALALIAALLIACQGGTSGSVVGSSERCSHNPASGTCEGSYRKLSGTYSKNVENDRIFIGMDIPVEVRVTVEGGAVRVSVESPDGEVTSATAEPGQPATLTGVAKGAGGRFIVRFEAVEGQATGVSYEIAYQIP